MVKKGKNYAETINAKSQNVDTSSAAELPKCKYNKSSIKTGSLCDKRGYLLLFIN